MLSHALHWLMSEPWTIFGLRMLLPILWPHINKKNIRKKGKEKIQKNQKNIGRK
jgi:hypothetical protein